MTSTDAPAAQAPALPIEMLLDLIGESVEADEPEGLRVISTLIRTQSVEATLDAVDAAAAKLRKRLPHLAVETVVKPYQGRDGADPLFCARHRSFGCTERTNPWSTVRCYEVPMPASFVDVYLTGLPVDDEGWHVGGVLTRDSLGVITATTVGGEHGEGSGFATAHVDLMGECVHCSRNVRRNTTVLLVSDQYPGEVRPVGKSCLAEYTGSALRTDILAGLTSLGERFAQAFGVVQGDQPDVAPVVDIVALAIRYVEAFGFVRAADGTIKNPATASRIREAIFWDGKNGQRPEIMADDLTGADLLAARAAIETVRDESADSADDRTNDYLWNLRAITEQDQVEVTGKRNKIGLLASLPGARERRARALQAKADREAAQAAKINTHFGEQGARLTLKGRVVVSTEVDTDWGVKDLLVVDTEQGQVKAFGTIGGRDNAEAGDLVALVGTVKGHDTYRGMAQTLLNRAKVTAVLEKAGA